jgi:hypothetical protein
MANHDTSEPGSAAVAHCAEAYGTFEIDVPRRSDRVENKRGWGSAVAHGTSLSIKREIVRKGENKGNGREGERVRRVGKTNVPCDAVVPSWLGRSS